MWYLWPPPPAWEGAGWRLKRNGYEGLSRGKGGSTLKNKGLFTMQYAKCYGVEKARHDGMLRRKARRVKRWLLGET